MILDPWHPDDSRVTATGKIPLHLAPLQSVIIRTFTNRIVSGKPWSLPGATVKTQSIDGPWKLEFIDGGPALPKPAELQSLASWTTLPDPAAVDFSGTARYTTTFDLGGAEDSAVQLDLGNVANTARVFLNDAPAAMSWCAPHLVDISGQLKPGPNQIAIEVTNLAANRIADLDRRNVPWKNFHEINFVNIDYQPFDGSKWPPLDSGLLGPVRLIVRERSR